MSATAKEEWRELPPEGKAQLLERLRRMGVPESTPGAKLREARGPLQWLLYYYKQTFTRPFAKYQREFWEDWAWDAAPNVGYRPRVECEPRGVGKSTSAEVFVVQGLARRKFNTVGYVSRTDEKASQHFASIKRKLEAPLLVADYPHVAPRVQTYRNMLSAWSQDRLVTDAGQMVIPITLLGSRRGFKSEDDVRFDLIVLDDIDELGESAMLRQKNLELLKSEILAAGTSATVVLFAQNLIYKDSICSQVYDHRADILSERDFRGPYPLMKWYDAEKRDLPDGAKKWVITAGDSYDPALDISYCESLLNQFGKATFDRECQQDTTSVADEKSFREYDEIYHVITWEEFADFFGDIARDVRGEPRIPAKWKKERGLDWGTTLGHPSACVFSTRPGEADPLNDCVFTFGEIIRPKWPPADPHAEPELVSPGRVAQAIKDFQRLHMIDESDIKGVMSHEASAALNTFLIDLPEEQKVFFSKWKARKGSGVPQIQEVLSIDYSRPNPFRKDPRTGQPIMGRPRHYIVVAKGQGELYYDSEGNLKVRQPTDEKGLARLRAEIPEFDERATGKDKIFDDAVDGWRGEAAGFFVTKTPLTEPERRERALPSRVQRANIPKLPRAEQERAVLLHDFLAEEQREEERKGEREGAFTRPKLRPGFSGFRK